jgi:hypothetical protein
LRGHGVTLVGVTFLVAMLPEWHAKKPTRVLLIISAASRLRRAVALPLIPGRSSRGR